MDGLGHIAHEEAKHTLGASVKERKKDGAYDKAFERKNDKCQEANHMVGHAGELKLPNKARHAQKTR